MCVLLSYEYNEKFMTPFKFLARNSFTLVIYARLCTCDVFSQRFEQDWLVGLDKYPFVPAFRCPNGRQLQWGPLLLLQLELSKRNEKGRSIQNMKTFFSHKTVWTSNQWTDLIVVHISYNLNASHLILTSCTKTCRICKNWKYTWFLFCIYFSIRLLFGLTAPVMGHQNIMWG